MKFIRYNWLIAVLILSGCGGHVALTPTNPAPTNKSVTIPWIIQDNCQQTGNCRFAIYRMSGACPSNLAQSAGWVEIDITTSATTTYVDSNVPNGTYSYDAEELTANVTPSNSGPSNCQTITVK